MEKKIRQYKIPGIHAMATCRKTAAAGIAATMERMPLYIFSTINAEQQQRKQKIAEGQPLG